MSSTSLKKPPPLQSGAPNNPVPFGHFYLLGLIARGGMAEVYRARRIDVEGPQKSMLAIKVIRPELAKEARFVDMFHREGQLALLLKNRSIVETIELGDIDGRHYIAMEYIGGRDLTQILRCCQKNDLRIPVPHVVHIGVGIADGLNFAHNLIGSDGRPLNLVNRDVSPSNVRVAYTGDVKLLDFGIAQALMKFTSEIGILKGKFSYMSPEQIRGMPVDPRTDIFSAGIILHEMLTTQKLFRGDTEFALMERVRKAEVEPPSKSNRRVTPELDRIVLKALARDVNERYQTASELHSDLHALLEGYRFDVRELRDFMRKEFRREFMKDQEDTNIALDSLPPSTFTSNFDQVASAKIPDTIRNRNTGPRSQRSTQAQSEDQLRIQANLPERINTATPTAPDAYLPESYLDTNGQHQSQNLPPKLIDEEKGGFFSRMFRKRK